MTGITECGSYHKVWQKVIQSVTGMQGLVVIKKCDMNSKVGQKTIKKCDRYCKVWQLLPSETLLKDRDKV